MWTCSMRRWPLGIYTHARTFEGRIHPRSAWSFDAKVCMGTYKMLCVNAWLWCNYFISISLIAKMIELLSVRRSFPEWLWIQGKDCMEKVAMFDWMLYWKYKIVWSMIVKSWVLEVYFICVNKVKIPRNFGIVLRISSLRIIVIPVMKGWYAGMLTIAWRIESLISRVVWVCPIR